MPVLGLGVVTNGAGQTGLNHIEVQERSNEARALLAAILGVLLASDPAA